MHRFDAPPDCLVTARAAILRERTLSPAFVLVRGGIVEYVGEKHPEGADPALPTFTFHAICEPLADAHVHLFLTGASDPAERKKASLQCREAAIERIVRILEELRRSGIAAVRDGGDPHGLALEAARLARADKAKYAQVAPSGEPIYRRGSYGGFLGKGVADVREAGELIKRNAKAGATQIKVLATGLNSLEVPGEVGAVQWSRAELSEIGRIAEDHGLSLMIHANGPCREIVEVMPASLEHGFWMEEGDIALLAERGVAWTPTIGAWLGILGEGSLTEAGRATVETTAARQRLTLARASRSGVRIAAGSDAGTPGVAHTDGLVRELRHLSEGGMGLEGALRASMRESVGLCGFAGCGLSIGGRAEFVVLNGFDMP